MFGNGKYAPSVCSLVASADEDCTIWVHSFRVQRRGNELITALDEMLSDVLLKRSKYLVRLILIRLFHNSCWFQGSDDWPDRIVFIRDGVSEGNHDFQQSQSGLRYKRVFVHFLGKMEDVTFQEVDAIKTVYSKAGKNSPDVTVFAAIRNHQTRFWDPKSENSRANLGNKIINIRFDVDSIIHIFPTKKKTDEKIYIFCSCFQDLGHGQLNLVFICQNTQ